MPPVHGWLSRPLRNGFASAGIIHTAAYLLMRNNASPTAAAFLAYALAAVGFMTLLRNRAPEQKNWFSPWHQRAVALVIGIGAFDCILLPTATGWLGALGVSGIMAATVWYGNVFWLRAVTKSPVRLSPKQQQLRDYAPAVLLFFAIAGMLCRTTPSLFGSGEMWAEAATNYFWHARYDDFLTNLKTLDAGYVPLAARLCAVAIQASHLSPQLIPYAYQAWTLLFISACVGYFALPRWRCLIPSDLARCMICVALACHPDFDLKAFINFPYYGAIPLLLHLSVLVQAQLNQDALLASPPVPAWRVVGLTLFTGVFCISKPHFIAFAPTLALLLVLGLRRFRVALVAPACAGLLAIGIQMLVLLQSRAADTQTVRAGPAVLARWLAQLSFAIPAITLGGKPIWVPALVNHPLSTCMVLGGLLAAGVVAHQILRGDRRAVAGVVVVGLSTFVGALALSVMAFLSAYQAVWQEHNFESFALRWFFMPCLAIFLVLAVTIAQSKINRYVPWLLGAWLLASFPFGFGVWPADAVWSKVGYSSWQNLAPQVFGADGDKGCIPVDPLPFTFKVNCEPLLDLAANEQASGFLNLTKELVMPAPKDAASWSVDSFSVLFDRPPPFNSQPDALLITAKALGKNGQVLGTSQAHSKPGTLSVTFAFKPAVDGVAGIALKPARAGSLNLISRSVQTLDPIWMWFGRRLQGTSVAKG